MEIPQHIDQKADDYRGHYPEDQARSATLPLLHLIQEEFGFINDESVAWVAKKLDLEPINVLEVVTFYPGLRQSAPGKYHIKEFVELYHVPWLVHMTQWKKSCEVTGIDRSSVSHHQPIAVSEDGKFSIEFAECLASCGTGPVCLIGDDFHESVKASEVKKLLNNYD